MNKMIALAAAAMLAMPCVSMADGVLVDGWKQASLDDLIDARSALDQQITFLRTQAEVDDALVFNGSGMSVIEGFTLPAGAWAYLVQLPDAATGTTTICEGGKNFTDSHFSAYSSFVHPAHYPKGMTIDYITMDYPGEWQLTISPIQEVNTVECTLTGSSVSGFFLPHTAQMVTITTTAGSAGYFSLYALEANIYRTSQMGKIAAHGTLEAGATQTDTFLLAPDKNVYGYVWFLNAPSDFICSITIQ